MHYKAHPAAELFPMLSESELDELAADIKINGQHEPIEILDMLVLDGRNRQEACRRASVPVKWRLWESNGRDPVAWVLSKNLLRRHLNESQRALIAAAALPLLEAEAAKRMKAGTPVPQGTGGRATEIAAAAVGASSRSVARAKAVMESAAPERIEAIRTGKATLKQVERETKYAKLTAQARVYVPPTGLFEVVVTDWPWKYGDALDGKGMERPLPYPPQTIEEICIDIQKMRCFAPNVALFCWVTTPILIDPLGWPVVCAALRNCWGFEQKQMRTWVKTEASGGDFIGYGHVWRGDTEHLVRLERGRPVFNEMGAAHGRPIQRTSFRAPIGEHSEKPQVAYDDIVALCASTSRLELHSRKPREGWVTSGSEMPAAKKRKLQIVDVTEAA